MKNIKCKTVFLKAQTKINKDGILMAALSEEDLEKAAELIVILFVSIADMGFI